MERYLYSELASLIQARLTCMDKGNTEWKLNHEARIEELVKEHMPSGSGFDNGTTIDFDHSHADKLVFNTSFHHMNENGYYDGWTEHAVTVTPSLVSRFHIRVSGRNRSAIKDYIHEAFACSLHELLKIEVVSR